MEQTTKPPTLLPSSDEIRSSGRYIDYPFLLTDGLKNINLISGTKDSFNSVENFNLYNQSINNIKILTNAYEDDEYYDDLSALRIDYPIPSNIEDKIKLLQLNYSATMRLLKRKGFTPPDDRLGNSFVLYNEIRNRVSDEYDAQIIIEGERGTGKSTIGINVCMNMADIFNLEWNVKKHLFFGIEPLRKYITVNKPIARGQPFLCDDISAGKGMGRRRAMTTPNIEFFEILQSMRELGLIMVYTSPDKDYVDSGQKELFTHNIETVKLDKIEKINIAKVKRKEGQYWKYPKDSEGSRYSRVYFEKPPEDIIKIYKKLKNESMYSKIKPTDDKKKNKIEVDFEKIKEIIRKDTKPYLKYWGGKKLINPRKIWRNFKDKGVTKTDADMIKEELEGEMNV